MNDNTITLKLCPFCGSEPSHWPTHTNEFTNCSFNEYISCKGCDVQMGNPLGRAAKDVVKQWNTRPNFAEDNE